MCKWGYLLILWPGFTFTAFTRSSYPECAIIMKVFLSYQLNDLYLHFIYLMRREKHTNAVDTNSSHVILTAWTFHKSCGTAFKHSTLSHLQQFLTDTSIPSRVSQDREGTSSWKVMDLWAMHLLCPPGISAAMLGQSLAAPGSLVPVSSPPQAERMADHWKGDSVNLVICCAECSFSAVMGLWTAVGFMYFIMLINQEGGQFRLQ